MRRILIILTVLTMVSSIAFAAMWLIDKKQAPPVALPDAYRAAATALGSATNEYHCMSAAFMGSYCQPGAWFFHFSSTNGTEKTVIACPDGSVRVQDGSITSF